MNEYEEIKLIDISEIRIVNPRSRSKSIHDELVESIKNIGLKNLLRLGYLTQPVRRMCTI